MRTAAHQTVCARHATVRCPRVSHLKNQLAELVASGPLPAKSRRSLSETVRGDFIHPIHHHLSSFRSFSSSSISRGGSETVGVGAELDKEPEFQVKRKDK